MARYLSFYFFNMIYKAVTEIFDKFMLALVSAELDGGWRFDYQWLIVQDGASQSFQ